ncbi:MAG: sulfatase [Planctomycetota bacterium]
MLFISVDDLKPSIGSFGDEIAVTPNMDRLAAKGTAFTNAHCQQAICSPSRVSLLTGLRPDATRVWDLQTKFRDTIPDVVTLPQRFREAGYHTVGIGGKIFHGHQDNNDDASWSEPFTRVVSPASPTWGYLEPRLVAEVERNRSKYSELPRGRKQQLNALFPDKRPPTERMDVADNAYSDGVVTDEAVRRMPELAASDQPFFLAVGYDKPHLPFIAPEKYWQLYDAEALPLAEVTEAPSGAPGFAAQPGWELRGGYNVPQEGPIPVDLQRELIHGYYACVSYVDAQVGRLLDALEENGLADNTIVVFWGDHGFHLGDHAIWCKHTNYEQATRSPLIFAAPGVGVEGATAEAPVEFVDVYPTMLDLAGIPVHDALHGTSLVPMMEDPSASVKPAAISQYPRGGGNSQRMGYAYRTDRYRLVIWRAMNFKAGETTGPIVATELYDYEVDPLETRNLAEDPGYASVRSELESLAEQLGVATE